MPAAVLTVGAVRGRAAPMEHWTPTEGSVKVRMVQQVREAREALEKWK